jgi:alcohol dehydrogenase class IV
MNNLFDSKKISNLKKILKDKKRIFLVTGKKSFEKSGAKALLNEHLIDKEFIRFSNFKTNPEMEDLKSGIEIFKNFNPEIVIAVGGGSVIDIAKLINIFSFQNSSPEKIINDKKNIKKRGLQLIAIPSTTGTGSEVTQFSVVYKDKKKYSVDHEYLTPTDFIIEPKLAVGLPSYVMACSAFDALSQATESFWSVNSSEESKSYSKKAIKLLTKSISSAVISRNLDDIKNLFLGANLAGRAINLTRTTAPHAFSYPLTSRYGIPHGHAVAVLLGKFFVVNSNSSLENVVDQRGKKYLDEMFHELFNLFECKTSQECEKYWYDLMKKLSLETNLKKLGVNDKKDILTIFNNVNFERLKNNPTLVTEDKFSDILLSLQLH